MIMKAAAPSRFRMKTLPTFRALLMPGEGEIHYIGGTDILPAPLDSREEARVLGELGTERDREAKSSLIEHNLRLVVYIAKKFDNTSVGVEDLISIGTIGLIKAINTFNTGKNIKLATYASRCIENEILMYFRSQRKYQGDVSLSDSIDSDREGNALSLMDVISVDDDMLETLDTRDSCAKVRQCVEHCLSEREAKVISLRYGLDGEEPPKTQREIAVQCGISRSYVSRLEKKALAKLREEMEKKP